MLGVHVRTVGVNGIVGGGLWLSRANSHYNRVIADGGTIEDAVIMQEMTKDIYTSIDNFDNLNTVVDAALGYKLNTGNTNGWPIIEKLYNLTDKGDYTQVTAANMPILCKYEGLRYWASFGSLGGGYLKTSAGSNTTGDTQIDVLLSVKGTVSNGCIFAQTSGSYKTFRLTVTNATNKVFGFNFSKDGTNEINSSSANTITPNGDKFWLRCTRNITTGDVSYYWSEDDSITHEPVSWTLIRTQAIPSQTGQLYQQAQPYEIGSDTNGAAHFWNGGIYKLRFWDAGVQKVNFDPANYNPAADMVKWTDSYNTWNINVSGSGYCCGVVFRSTLFYDITNDALTASISLRAVPAVFGNIKEKTTGNYYFGAYKFTATTQTLGYNADLYLRNRTSLIISFDEQATHAYAQNALDWYVRNWALYYYSNSGFNHSEKGRYKGMKAYHNSSTQHIYGAIPAFITKYNAGTKTKIMTIGDSTSPLGIYAERILFDKKAGTNSVGWCNAGLTYYDDKVVPTRTGTWTDKIISSTERLTNDDEFGVSGFSTVPSSGATLTFTPNYKCSYTRFRIWYLQDTGSGTFNINFRGIDTPVNAAGAKMLKYVDITTTKGQHSAIINTISGTVRFYGASFLNDDDNVGYHLCRGGSRSEDWVGRPHFLSFLNFINPDLLLTQIGINDGNVPATIMPNIESMLSEIYSNFTGEVILCTSGGLTTDGITNDTTTNTNAQLLWDQYKDLIDSNNLDAAFNLNLAFPTWTVGADYRLYLTNTTDDYVHPNYYGTKIQGEQIVKGFFNL
jgi:hypothetical protein